MPNKQASMAIADKNVGEIEQWSCASASGPCVKLMWLLAIMEVMPVSTEEGNPRTNLVDYRPLRPL